MIFEVLIPSDRALAAATARSSIIRHFRKITKNMKNGAQKDLKIHEQWVLGHPLGDVSCRRQYSRSGPWESLVHPRIALAVAGGNFQLLSQKPT